MIHYCIVKFFLYKGNKAGDKMNYIVLDLEWNQSSDLAGIDIVMPFEIIEIGAVKLDDSFHVIDEFNGYVKPSLYPKFHYKVKEMLKYDERKVSKKKGFKDVANRFFKWCGESYIFCTWGDSDLIQLQRNMTYYGMMPLYKPLRYYNLQKIFSQSHDSPKQMFSLERAVELCNINKKDSFHHAIHDARYTAAILAEYFNLNKSLELSLDYYNNPKNKEEEVRTLYNNHYEYVTMEYNGKDEIFDCAEVRGMHCYLCDNKITKEIKWFASSNTVYYAVGKCKQHGYIFGKIKIKTTMDGSVFGIKTLSCVDESILKSIENRKEELKIKKNLKQIKRKLQSKEKEDQP